MPVVETSRIRLQLERAPWRLRSRFDNPRARRVDYPRMHESEQSHIYASAESIGAKAQGFAATACAWCTGRAWAIPAAICRRRISSRSCISTCCDSILRSLPARRDRFILSKGHCSAALYATLAEAGFFPAGDLDEYMRPLSRLNGHPDRNKVPGVEANTGPLGHGLPVAVGAAIAAKLDRAAWRTFVLTGDGELQEGSNWEAAMCGAQYRLDNLTVIVDRNRLQQGDRTEQTVALEPLGRSLARVRLVSGRGRWPRHRALLAVLARRAAAEGRPTCVIAQTNKGRGVSFMEDKSSGTIACPPPPSWRRHSRSSRSPADDRCAARLPRRLCRYVGRARGAGPAHRRGRQRLGRIVQPARVQAAASRNG